MSANLEEEHGGVSVSAIGKLEVLGTFQGLTIAKSRGTAPTEASLIPKIGRLPDRRIAKSALRRLFGQRI